MYNCIIVAICLLSQIKNLCRKCFYKTRNGYLVGVQKTTRRGSAKVVPEVKESSENESEEVCPTERNLLINNDAVTLERESKEDSDSSVSDDSD